MDAAVLDAITTAWKEAGTVVVFTGAGMSTESGLPDFRSSQGLWRSRPESLASLTALETQPDDFYYFYQWRIAKLWAVTPNVGHDILAELERHGRVHQLVTQNVDGLHQRAGAQHVLELHGSLRSVSCRRCRKRYDSRQLLQAAEIDEFAYQSGLYRHGAACFCPCCGGALRPDVVLFGESLPDHAWTEAVRWSGKADLFVVLGSSLLVSPANYLPRLAVEQGAKLLMINQEPTPLDGLATWVLREKCGVMLAQLQSGIVNE